MPGECSPRYAVVLLDLDCADFADSHDEFLCFNELGYSCVTGCRRFARAESIGNPPNRLYVEYTDDPTSIVLTQHDPQRNTVNPAGCRACMGTPESTVLREIVAIHDMGGCCYPIASGSGRCSRSGAGCVEPWACSPRITGTWRWEPNLYEYAPQGIPIDANGQLVDGYMSRDDGSGRILLSWEAARAFWGVAWLPGESCGDGSSCPPSGACCTNFNDPETGFLDASICGDHFNEARCAAEAWEYDNLSEDREVSSRWFLGGSCSSTLCRDQCVKTVFSVRTTGLSDRGGIDQRINSPVTDEEYQLFGYGSSQPPGCRVWEAELALQQEPEDDTYAIVPRICQSNDFGVHRAEGAVVTGEDGEQYFEVVWRDAV